MSNVIKKSKITRVPKKRELKANRKSNQIKIRTVQTLKKELLRDFRNLFRDPFLSQQDGKHNHILKTTQKSRVRAHFKELGYSETFIVQHEPILFELVLPKRKEFNELFPNLS